MLSESLEAVVAQTLAKKVGGGRIAAQEILIGVPAVRNLIREQKLHQIPGMMQTGKAVGMCTLDMALQELVKKNPDRQEPCRSRFSGGRGDSRHRRARG